MRAHLSGFRLPLAAFVLCLGLAIPPAAGAWDNQALRHADPVWKDGGLEHLSKYIGTDNNRAVLDDPYVAKTMKWKFHENYEAIRERLLSSRHIISFDIFFMTLAGSLPARNNHIEAACLVIDLSNGILYAGLQSGGKMIVYGNHGPDLNHPDYGELPIPLLMWVKLSDALRAIDEPPTKNFEWRFKAPPPDGK